ncbi:MAG: ATP-binding cassette domain-containing protein [Candidatus Zixiibacteriota bacterium]
MADENFILETDSLTRTVSKNGVSKNIIDSISTQFKPGLIYNIIGPSGAGKSSFLRLLNRLDEPTAGTILFHNQPTTSYPPTELRRKIGLLFQTPYLFDGTVRTNLEYCCGLKEPDFHIQILEKVGLNESFLENDVADLSIGEKQRVALARSLILNPEILLLDEPTSALDPSYSRKIEELILSLSSELGLTILIVTHSPEQALRLGGQSLLLVKGRLIETGETSLMLKSPQSELGQKYINRELT